MSNTNKLLLAICLTLSAGIFIAGGTSRSKYGIANANQPSTAQTVYLSDLPTDCARVLSMANTAAGVSVCYLTESGKVRMIEYVSSGDGKYRVFLFRFESDKE